MKKANANLVIIATWKTNEPDFYLVSLTVEFESGQRRRYFGDTVEEILLTLPHKERFPKFVLNRKQELPDVTLEWWLPGGGV